MPDEKAAAVATCTPRGREDAPAAPRHASLIVFVEINCFRPGDPQHCASQGAQLPVARPTPASWPRRRCAALLQLAKNAAFQHPASPHFSHCCGMMAQGSVGHCRANRFSRRRQYRVYWPSVCNKCAKTCWRGKDQASTRESVRNAGQASAHKSTLSAAGIKRQGSAFTVPMRCNATLPAMDLPHARDRTRRGRAATRAAAAAPGPR